MNINTFILFLIMVGLTLDSYTAIDDKADIITAIQDNGCSSHQELSPTKSNADVYNYAALSTSYNKGE